MTNALTFQINRYVWTRRKVFCIYKTSLGLVCCSKDCKCLDCTHKEVPLSDPYIKVKKTKGITTCAEVDYIKGISSTHIGAYICTRKEYMQAHTCIRTRIRTFLHNPGCHNLAHDALQQTIQALSLDFVASLMNALRANQTDFVMTATTTPIARGMVATAAGCPGSLNNMTTGRYCVGMIRYQE